MTQTHLVISLLSDGKPRNVHEIIQQTGLSEVAVRSTLTRMALRKDLSKHRGELIRYAMTLRGRRRLEEQARGNNTPLVSMAPDVLSGERVGLCSKERIVSNREKIYHLLENGGSLTSRQLSEMLGLPLRVVQDTLASMRDRGFVEPKPVTYMLSEEGKSMLVRKKRAAPSPVVCKSKRAEREVQGALSRRHALDQCWGASA